LRRFRAIYAVFAPFAPFAPLLRHAHLVPHGRHAHHAVIIYPNGSGDVYIAFLLFH
jgi:hypothetical protein